MISFNTTYLILIYHYLTEKINYCSEVIRISVCDIFTKELSFNFNLKKKKKLYKCLFHM